MHAYFPILLLVLGACLVYSEINRIFTRTLAAVAENVADVLWGNGLKVVLGFGLMYAGYMLWLGLQPGRLLLEFQFPFFRPLNEERDAFLGRCLRIGGLPPGSGCGWAIEPYSICSLFCLRSG